MKASKMSSMARLAGVLAAATPRIVFVDDPVAEIVDTVSGNNVGGANAGSRASGTAGPSPLSLPCAHALPAHGYAGNHHRYRQEASGPEKKTAGVQPAVQSGR